MLEIDVKNDIENENDVFCWFDEEPKVFSLQTVKDIIANNPNEDEIKLNIHCRGGSVEEGLAIYDYLRSSGKTIYSNIEGGCHSMAVVLLLAAPKENRTANPNCSAMIHKVSTFAFGVATIDELESTLDSLKKSTEKILDIYADRTGKDKEELRTIMNEQKERTAQELLDYGFISKINTYNTNKKEIKNNIINKKQNKKMGEKKKGTIKNIVNDFLSRIDNAINGTVMNYDFPDKDGNVMFSTTEKGADDDTLAEGDKATPDGTFELANDTSELKAGSVIVIENGEITKITPKEDETAPEGEGNNDLEKENEELKAENKNLKGLLNESKGIILDLKKNTKSDKRNQRKIEVLTANYRLGGLLAD
jgi:ATP-dependent protease ClpP protease subunit